MSVLKDDSLRNKINEVCSIICNGVFSFSDNKPSIMTLYSIKYIENFIPVGINDDRHLFECNSNRNRKVIMVGKNIQQYCKQSAETQRTYYLHMYKLLQIDNT